MRFVVAPPYENANFLGRARLRPGPSIAILREQCPAQGRGRDEVKKAADPRRGIIGVDTLAGVRDVNHRSRCFGISRSAGGGSHAVCVRLREYYKYVRASSCHQIETATACPELAHPDTGSSVIGCAVRRSLIYRHLDPRTDRLPPWPTHWHSRLRIAHHRISGPAVVVWGQDVTPRVRGSACPFSAQHGRSVLIEHCGGP